VFCGGQGAAIAPHRSPKFSERNVTRQIRPRIVLLLFVCFANFAVARSTAQQNPPNRNSHNRERYEIREKGREFLFAAGTGFNPATDRDSKPKTDAKPTLANQHRAHRSRARQSLDARKTIALETFVTQRTVEVTGRWVGCVERSEQISLKPLRCTD
jgi:hypothetical protein